MNNEWYRDQKILVGSLNDSNIAILCVSEFPTDIEIQTYINGSEKLALSNDFKKLIVTKNGTKEIHESGIEILSEEWLLNNLIDFTDYKNYIIEQFDKKEIIEGYQLSLKDVFVTPFCFKKHYDKTIDEIVETKIDKPIEHHIFEWINDNKTKRHLAILGEYGQGKSVLSLYVAYKILSDPTISDRIPIIIELRGKYPKQYANVLTMLGDWASSYHFDAQALYMLHQAGKLLIVFEGFDEMELIGDYEIRLDHFRRLWEFSSPQSKIVITGRPNFFLNNAELKTLLRIKEENVQSYTCEELYLSRFTEDQIKNALRNSDADTRKDLIDLLSTQNPNSSFYDLLSRPSSLFLTSIVWKERNLSKFKSNINSAFVIQEFLKNSYERQDSKGIKTPLSVRERSYFMMGIAIGMVQKFGYTNQINSNDLKILIDDLYENFPDQLTLTNTNQKDYTKNLKKRFDERYNKESVFIDVRSCGVLTRDLSTFDSFKFAHKSFLEILVSQFIVTKMLQSKLIEKEDLLITNSIQNALKVNYNEISKSPDVLKFLSQLTAQNITIPQNLDASQKIKFLFKNITTFRFLGFGAVSRIIPSLSFSSLYISIILASGVLLLGLISGFITRDTSIFNYYSSVAFLIIFPFLFFMHRSLKRMLYDSRIYRAESILADQNYESSLRLSIAAIGSTLLRITELNDFLNVDKSNLLLWFMVCKELQLEDDLRELIPESSFIDLELQEAILLRNKRYLSNLVGKRQTITIDDDGITPAS